MQQFLNSKTLTIFLTTLLLILVCVVQQAIALPPEVEADRLLLSAAGKLDQKNYAEAGQDLDKIKALGVKLPAEYYFQNGRYLVSKRDAVEAKKSLESYLDKAGKEGKFYQAALKLYSDAEANEKSWEADREAEKKRLSRFKANGDGTVTDTRTGLMWAAKDNGEDISWSNAKQYCASFTGGGYKDWRLPTRKELKVLNDEETAGNKNLRAMIKRSGCCVWAADTVAAATFPKAATFDFSRGVESDWFTHDGSNFSSYRALPVRGSK